MLGSEEIAPANPAWGLESLTLGRPATVSSSDEEGDTSDEEGDLASGNEQVTLGGLGGGVFGSMPSPSQLDLDGLSANVKGLMKLELSGDVANGDLATLFPLKNLKSLVIKECSGVSGD